MHISFVASTDTPVLNVLNGQHPLFALLSPNDYYKVTPKLRSRSLLFLSQLVTNDGKALITWDSFYHQFIRRGPTDRIPPWFHLIKAQACLSPSSFWLLAQWCVQDRFIQDFVLSPLNPRPFIKDFLAVWHETSNSMIIGRSIKKKPHNVVRIEHWIPEPVIDFLTPLSKPARISACSGCSLNSTSHFSKDVSCGFDIPGFLAFTLPLHKSFKSCSYTQHTKIPVLTIRDSLHNVHASALRLFNDTSFESALATALPVAPSPILPVWPAFDSSFDATRTDADSYFNDAPWLHPSRCDIYIDGSLSHLGSSAMVMGSGWLVHNPANDNRPWVSCQHRSFPFWPSSTRAELSALVSFLLMCPPALKINLFTDATSIINGLHQILYLPLIFRKLQLRKHNYILWNMVATLIHTQQLDIRTFKVKAHSGNPGNTQADELAKAGSIAQSSLSCPDSSSSNLPYIPYFQDIPIDADIRHLVKAVFQAKAFRAFQRFARFHVLSNTENVPPATIDWPASWSMSFPKDMYSHSSTSFVT